MNIFSNIIFLNPSFFWGFIIVPVILYLFYQKQKSWINFINLWDIKKVFKVSSYKFYLSIILLWLILTNFIIILANPNKVNISEKIKKKWIDIVITLDVSKSMEAQDLKPNRLESAKKVINWFIKSLKTDRVWIVLFAWKSFTSIPLTFDYNILSETINRLSTRDIQSNWTAVWDAILMSKTLFKNDEDEKEQDREKVIILLTDWNANTWIDPRVAWISAKEKWIKIYTIWIWSKKWWYIEYKNWPFISRQKIWPLNDKNLKYIAKTTNWKYFRADSETTFKAIFQELQKLEKNDIDIKIKKKYTNYYDIFVYSLIFLMIWFSILMINNIEMSTINISKKKSLKKDIS
jgi:Ca-activated chloride channel family protein